MSTGCPNTSASSGNALVDAVEHAGEVEVGRQPQRREAVARDAEIRERLVVGAAAHQIRDDGHARVVPAERRDHRVDEVALERNLEADVLVDDLDLDIVADDPPDVVEHILLGAGQGSHVDQRLGAVGDDVVLVAGGQAGRIGRGAQRRAQESGCRARRGRERIRVVRMPRP